jgi:hypothetical protein
LWWRRHSNDYTFRYTNWEWNVYNIKKNGMAAHLHSWAFFRLWSNRNLGLKEKKTIQQNYFRWIQIIIRYQ